MTNIQSYPKQDIRLAGQHGDIVPAYKISDQFAIHRSVGNDYDNPGGWVLSEKFWTITHIPTGKSLFNYFHVGKHALETVKQVENRWGELQLKNEEIDRDKHPGFVEFYFDVKARINQGY